MRLRPIIAIDLTISGKCGGPYVSSSRIMNSGLKEKYDFKVIYYDTSLGKGISIKRIIDLKNQIKKINPDIVHFSGLLLSGFHLAIACKLAGIKKTFVTIHGISRDDINFHPIKKVLMTYFLEPLTLLLATRNCGVSEYVISRRIVKLFAKKCVGAVYNFPPEPYMVDDNIDFRQELGFSDADIVIASVARITKDKGYHVLDEAILNFSHISNLKFVIVGDGSYLTQMKERLKVQVNNGQVVFLGYRQDIQKILNSCNIFVLPTLHETLSIALLEASVEKLALIASDTGGVPEIVENGYNGLLVTPGNVEELTNAINRLFSNIEQREVFAKNARIKIQQKFSHDLIEAKIDQVYQTLLHL